MMRIMLLGAPGSGKGTQAQRLQAKYGVPQVSSGDLLRDAVARGTELGMKAKAVMEAGQLVSDDIVLGLIRERLSRPDAANGFILDGFPRNIEQANALDQLLRELGQPLDAVLLLDVSRDTLIQRLAGRRICPKCGAVYNVHSMAPGATGCSNDGTELEQRPDDKEDVVIKRLEVYEQQTRPLIDHFAKQGLLRVIAGEGEFEEVFERLESAALAKPIAADRVKVTSEPAKQPAKKSASPTRGAKKSAAKKPAAKKPAARKPAAKSKRAGAKKKAGTKARASAKSAKKSAKKSARKTVAKAAKKATRKVAKKAKRVVKTGKKRPAKKAVKRARKPARKK
jgi:adenylate kinase